VVLVVPPVDEEVVAPGVVVVVAPPLVEEVVSPSGTVVVEAGTISGSNGSRGCAT
jgi:hypothetical protein